MTRTDPVSRFFVLPLLWAATAMLGYSSSSPVHAQALFDEPPAESAVPPAPSFSTQNLLTLSGGTFSTLRLGVDPATLAIGSDGVVRYVLVAINSAGKASGLYEGIRCTTAESKLYARYNSESGWVSVKEPQWQSLFESGPSKHSLRLARSGICAGATANGSVQQIIKDLQGEVQPL